MKYPDTGSHISVTPFTYILQFKNQSEIKMNVDANGAIDKTFSQEDLTVK